MMVVLLLLLLLPSLAACLSNVTVVVLYVGDPLGNTAHPVLVLLVFVVLLVPLSFLPTQPVIVQLGERL